MSRHRCPLFDLSDDPLPMLPADRSQIAHGADPALITRRRLIRRAKLHKQMNAAEKAGGINAAIEAFENMNLQLVPPLMVNHSDDVDPDEPCDDCGFCMKRCRCDGSL